ncbi:hypothetical protein OH76DRAFT_1487015 [Lentinus brumalis]|uniref:Uncharacterized protein n=1 Tax=Lentinus brumalis TaxID=2498619 RepID=A0A371CWE1_9APHY|nr:hypothetical protein OH76DRAFT_1487015 [Polyporus brumalis]
MTSTKRKNPARGANTADVEMKRARLDDRSSPSPVTVSENSAGVGRDGIEGTRASTPSDWEGSRDGVETPGTDADFAPVAVEQSGDTLGDLTAPTGDAVVTDPVVEPAQPDLDVNDPGGAVPPAADDVLNVTPLTSDSTPHHPSFVGMAYVPYEDLQRAVGFAQKDEASTKRYALSKIPADASWGTTPSTERLLCDKSGTPLTCWLLSTIHSKWFYNMNGDPQSRVNVGLKLPFVGDYDALRRLYGKGRPKREIVPDVVYASRMMSRQPKGEDATIILPFTALYDARERFRPKKDMTAISPQAIGKGDLVLVETLVSRWKTSKDKKNRKGWSLWDVGFELQAISHLFDAPEGRLNRIVRGSTISPHATPIYDSLRSGYWDRPNRSATWFANRRPVKVCVLAEVLLADVLHGDDLLPRAFIDLHLLRETDRIAFGDLMRLAHPPPPARFVPQTVTASLSMSAIRSVLPATYDASKRLRPARCMPRLEFIELRPGDIVLVEMFCTRTVYIDKDIIIHPRPSPPLSLASVPISASLP